MQLRAWSDADAGPSVDTFGKRKVDHMNTADLIERVATEHGIAKEHVKKVLDSTFAVITAAAASGEEIAVAGFGRFKVTALPERQGRNPATGEPITIAASKKLSFSPAKAVREALNAATANETAAAA